MSLDEDKDNAEKRCTLSQRNHAYKSPENEFRGFVSSRPVSPEGL